MLFPFIYKITIETSIELIGRIALYFLAPLLIWLISKPFVLKSVETTGLKKQLISFKRDKDTFTIKLSQQQQFNGIKGIAQSIWEESGVENQLVLVSNPYCEPCSKVYNQLNKLKKHFSKKLNVSIIYAVPNDDKDIRYKTAANLLSIYQQAGLEKANEISKEWYQMTMKDSKKLEKTYPLEDTTKGELLLQKQIEWCMQNQINYTPALLLNGRLLPTEYEIDDLIYFIN